MKKLEKQILIESMKEGLENVKEECKLWFAHNYLQDHKELNIRYKDYYEIMCAILKK